MAPALLVRVRLGPGLRTLETCSTKTLGGRKTCMLWQTFQSCKYSVIVNRADTLCEHRMFFMKASEDHLPNDLIWLSDMPYAAAVVAAPIRKVYNLNCFGVEMTKL